MRFGDQTRCVILLSTDFSMEKSVQALEQKQLCIKPWASCYTVKCNIQYLSSMVIQYYEHFFCISLPWLHSEYSGALIPQSHRAEECLTSGHKVQSNVPSTVTVQWNSSQGFHISELTKFHISMIFPVFFKKIPGIFPIIFRPPIIFG